MTGITKRATWKFPSGVKSCQTLLRGTSDLVCKVVYMCKVVYAAWPVSAQNTV